MPMHKTINHTHTNQLFRCSRSLLALGIGLGIAIGCVGMLGGCQKSVMRPNETRSQFERYDQSRSQHAQPFLEDEFGRRTPNLSERLLDRGE